MSHSVPSMARYAIPPLNDAIGLPGWGRPMAHFPGLPTVPYGFSCITVTTVMQENLLCEAHAVRCRVSCIMGAPNHDAGNPIEAVS